MTGLRRAGPGSREPWRRICDQGIHGARRRQPRESFSWASYHMRVARLKNPIWTAGFKLVKFRAVCGSKSTLCSFRKRLKFGSWPTTPIEPMMAVFRTGEPYRAAF